MSYIFTAIAVAILFISWSSGFCQTDNKTEERSAIVEADGYAYLSEDKTIKELREEARIAAKREASERGQTYIKSLTKIENFQLAYDIIWGETEGLVSIIESKDYGITADNRYRYWIKAEVRYSLKEEKEPIPIDVKTNTLAPLTVSVWTEKQEFVQDEEIKIFIQGNKDFYAKIVYEDASGNLLQLLPNQYRKDNLFKANVVYSFPDQEDKFILKVKSPYGTEKIFMYASSVALGETAVKPYGESLYMINDNLAEYSAKTRGLKISSSGNETLGAEFFETNCLIVTKQ